MADEPSCPAASEQLRREIHHAVDRYAQESDLTVYQVIGVLEVVKLDLVEALEERKK